MHFNIFVDNTKTEIVSKIILEEFFKKRPIALKSKNKTSLKTKYFINLILKILLEEENLINPIKTDI